jgi:hypothetical protein
MNLSVRRSVAAIYWLLAKSRCKMAEYNKNIVVDMMNDADYVVVEISVSAVIEMLKSQELQDEEGTFSNVEKYGIFVKMIQVLSSGSFSASMYVASNLIWLFVNVFPVGMLWRLLDEGWLERAVERLICLDGLNCDENSACLDVLAFVYEIAGKEGWIEQFLTRFGWVEKQIKTLIENDRE